MFERLSEQARAAVVQAQQEARSLGHNYVGTEHLLLALAGQDSGNAAEVLSVSGVSVEGLRAAMIRMVGFGASQGRLTADDARALEMFGIDIEVVRARVEEVFGRGALDRPVFPERSRPRGRRRRRRSGTCGHETSVGQLPLTPRTKKVLELSLRESLALGHDRIGPEHVLLGLIREGQGLAVELLMDQGVHLQDLRQHVLDRLREVA